MDRLSNRKGTVIITTLIICMIISIIVISYNNLLFENYLSVQANTNSIKAYYIAESAINIVYYELNRICEEAIDEYFDELRVYKLYYLNLEEDYIYSPPVFENILRPKIVSNLSSFNRKVENPFVSYEQEHYFKITVDYVVSYNIMKIDVVGSYLHSRKLLTAEYLLPEELISGVDEYNLPRSKIRPLKINKVFHNVSIY